MTIIENPSQKRIDELIRIGASFTHKNNVLVISKPLRPESIKMQDKDYYKQNNTKK